jgi:hypothetical protein
MTPYLFGDFANLDLIQENARIESGIHDEWIEKLNKLNKEELS